VARRSDPRKPHQKKPEDNDILDVELDDEEEKTYPPTQQPKKGIQGPPAQPGPAGWPGRLGAVGRSGAGCSSSLWKGILIGLTVPFGCLIALGILLAIALVFFIISVMSSVPPIPPELLPPPAETEAQQEPEDRPARQPARRYGWPPRPGPRSTEITVDEFAWRPLPDFEPDGAIEYSGTVTSHSSIPLRFVQIRVSFYDADRSLLTTDSTYIDTEGGTLQPGQTATFRSWADYYAGATICRYCVECRR